MAIPTYMGFVGYVRFPDGTVRATSADLNLTQEITRPDLVDGLFDKTVYQLGPQLIDGSISFPAIYGSSSSDITVALYSKAVLRDSDGLLAEQDIDVRYTSTGASFAFKKCIINTWQFSVTQSDVVNITVDVIGTKRENATLDNAQPDNTRIVTWNDVVIGIDPRNSQGDSLLPDPIPGDTIRSFEANINNNAERFYTLNGTLQPQAVAPKKRDVYGSVVFMGRNTSLSGLASANETRCVETSTINFGYTTLSGCGNPFNVTLPSIVFEIEQMSLTNELFETTMNWSSLPRAPIGGDDPLDTAVSA